MGLPLPPELEEYEATELPIEASLAWHCWTWVRKVQALHGVERDVIELSREFCALHGVTCDLQLLNLVLVIHEAFTAWVNRGKEELQDGGDG